MARERHGQEYWQKVLSDAGGWVGFPPIRFGRRLEDGRMRADACGALGHPEWVPEDRYCVTFLDFIRALCAADEHERAADYIRVRGIELSDIAESLRLSAEDLAKMAKPRRVRRTNNGRKRQASRADALYRVSQLWVLAIETGNPINPSDLEKAMGQWLTRNARANTRVLPSLSGQDPNLSDESTKQESGPASPDPLSSVAP